MASYVPWYGKKREQLAKHEREFVALLQNTADTRKLRKAAEIVRAAQVRALKAQLARLPASEKSADVIANLEREIQFWLELPLAAILEMYRLKVPPKTPSAPNRYRRASMGL
jgi:hypothetical protein